MLWQDIILAVGTWVMVICQFPTVLSKTRKPHVWTALPMLIILYIFAYVFATLDLYFTAVPTFIEGSIFGLLFYQSRKIRLIRI